jgi:Domain of unknown function (DUF4166)
MSSPFERLLGAAFEQLPAPVRRVHSLRVPLVAAGHAEITAASGHFARFICRFAGLPCPGRDVDVVVTFAPNETGGEHWDRKFADRRYTSTIKAGSGRDQGLLIERFRAFDLRFQLAGSREGVAWVLIGWRFLRIPLPLWSVPQVKCLESADGERYTFDIDVTFPLIGWLMHYRGWLLPQDAITRPAPHQSA